MEKSFQDNQRPGSKGLVFGLSVLLGLCLAAVAYLLWVQPPVPSLHDESRKEAKTEAKRPRVKLETTMGEIVLELDPEKAPISVANFLQYVKDGHYDGTLFHRVINNFMIQGGGLTPTGEKPTRPPIKNEASNGLLNTVGTVAMARTGEMDSATSQFFINVADNKSLDGKYAVFGTVVEGMAVVDKIKSVPLLPGNAPAIRIVINSARQIQ